MKVVIFAGGLGTRLMEETEARPKPMVEIGGKPILWHILKIYEQFGFNEFVILCGYKGYLIKEYFAHYFLHMTDVTIDMATNSIAYLNNYAEPWKVTLIDTGLETMTGGRIKRAINSLDDELICVTYGDGLANVNVKNLIDFHKSSKNLATVTAVRPPARFGRLKIIGDKVVNFGEKMQSEEGWINGGYFVLDKKVADYISGDEMPFEWDPLTKLTQERTLGAFFHEGFWAPVDTLREKKELEKFWNDSNPPWVMK